MISEHDYMISEYNHMISYKLTDISPDIMYNMTFQGYQEKSSFGYMGRYHSF
jgi:hypothetical protein